MAAEVSIGKYVYRKESIIGHGSFAIVFKGRFKEDRSKLVAVKCINQKNLSKTYALLQKEIQILKQLKHENIVQLYDCYQVRDIRFFLSKIMHRKFLHMTKSMCIAVQLRKFFFHNSQLHNKRLLEKSQNPREIRTCSLPIARRKC